MADETNIEELANEVATWGEEQQSIAGAASQGAFEAINGLVGVVRDLVKGKKGDDMGADLDANADEGDDERDNEDAKMPQGNDDEPEEDEEGAGFQDMEFATDATLDDSYDVTRFVLDLDSKVNAIGKQLQVSERENRRLRKAVAGLEGIILQLAEADARATVELTKAVAGLSVGVTAIPQRSAFQVAPARPGVPVTTSHHKPANNGEYLGGSERGQRILLAKGMNQGILDDGQKRRFYLEGRFDDDEAEDKRIRDALAAL